MKNILFIITLLCLSIMPCNAKVNIQFTPSRKCENSIITFIEKAKKSIDIAVYSINNNKIVETLKKAHDRGVKIRILTDRLQASGKSSKVIELYQYGINIRVHSKYKIEHNKFAIYDGKAASTGSYNWTNPASDKNSENCVFLTQDKNSVEDYQNRFDYLWSINTKKKSEKWFIQRIK